MSEPLHKQSRYFVKKGLFDNRVFYGDKESAGFT